LTENNPPIFLGFSEGLLMPITELISVTIISSFTLVSHGIGISSFEFSLLLVGLVIFDFARNIAIGLTHSQFATGNAIGAIFGIAIFYSSINLISPEAATDSLLLTVALVVSLAIGMIVAIRT
jgi:hypothetical protein